MPLLTSNYKSPYYLFNGHLETVVPSMFRQVGGRPYKRERLELPDGDFVDLDWLKQGSERLVIVSHGLEGSSERHYAKGVAQHFFQHGWDALAWNCRSCSGEINRLPRFYHHGDTMDLRTVIDHAAASYKQIVLVGISMGGSMALKYLGEPDGKKAHAVKAAVAFSVPCHLQSSAQELDKPSKQFYLQRFLRKLGRKIAIKARLFPDVVSFERFHEIRTFRDFDNRYTAPLHGFDNADDFYRRAACVAYLPGIKTPTLLVNAANDPFLTPSCFPMEIARDHNFFHLEIPATGGHVGFSLLNSTTNWMERRALEFVSSVL